MTIPLHVQSKIIKTMLSAIFQLVLSVVVITATSTSSDANSASEGEKTKQTESKKTSDKVIVNKTVKGTIKEKSGEPVIGASVVLKGTSTATATDADGKFSLEVPDEDAVLVISYLGFKTVEVAAGSKDVIDVTLEEDVTVLNEVVATGYGTMKVRDLSSAQVSVSAKEIERTVNTTFEQALQGRAAGVQVTQNSGQPGGGISVNIRGTASINGSTQPLYIIDGVQIQPQSGGGDYGSTSSSNPLAFINPSDIETMDVLQGPSATAIYGSRATNGVVLVTTKRGKSGNMKVDYAFTYTLQDTPKNLPVMNLQQYATLRNAQAKANGVPTDVTFTNPSVLGEGTNWQNELFQRSPLMKHQLSMSGGNDKTTYYVSGEYMKQDGVIIGSNFNRYGLRINIDNKTFKWLTVNQSLGLSHTQELLNTSADGAINTALYQSPGIAARNADGSYGGPSSSNALQITNPLAIANINDHTKVSNNIYGTVGAEVKIVKGLTFKTNFSGNMNFSTLYDWTPSYQFGGLKNQTTNSGRGSNYSDGYVWNEVLTYNRKFAEKHDLTLMASHESIYNEYESLYASTNNFSSNQVRELNDGAAVSGIPNSGRGSNALESYLGRFNYVYNDKYILQASIRNDGSSAFGPNNRYGVFPAISAAWRISQESFLRNIKQISDLKLRAEYGSTGNSGYGTNYLTSLSPSQFPNLVGYKAGNYSNPNLKWESTQTVNLGLNVGLFNNRIEFIGDFYIKNTSNLLGPLPLADYMGVSGQGALGAPLVNIGNLRNEGVALTLNTVNVESPFTWKSNFNFSLNRNSITSLYTNNTFFDKSSFWILGGGLIERSQVGTPVNQMLGYEYQGLIQNYAQLMDPNLAVPTANKDLANRVSTKTYVGDILWKDQNKDGVIDTKDLKVIGNPNPTFTFGFTNTFGYKNFELMVLCTGSYGNQIYNYTRMQAENPGNYGNRLLQATDFARIGLDTEGNPYITNAGTHIPRIAPGDGNGNYLRPSNQWVEDGSYLRVKNVQLSYSVPKKALSKLAFVQTVRVAIGCQNMFTITNYKGYDPEVGAWIGQNSSPGSTFQGVDYGRYPLTRMYTFALNVGF